MNNERLNTRNKAAESPKHWVRVTRACNNSCIFCLDSENMGKAYVPLREIKSQLKQGKRQGIKKLILSGGEPTLHPDYLEVVKFGRDTGYEKIQTVTNGRMFAYKDFLKEAVAYGLTETTFSIHAHTQELYEKQSRIKGSFKQALGGLFNALRIPQLIINIDIVINKINYRYLENIMRYFINLGVYEFDLLQVVPFGSAWKNKERLFYNFTDAIPYLRRAFSLQQEFPNTYIWTNRFPPQYLEGFEELIQHPFKLYDEVRGRKYIFNRFLVENKIMPCYGEQCNYCFLDKFCSDLIELKQKKEIIAKRPASCLKLKEERLIKFSGGNKIDVVSFLDFYIKHRYFLKSLRCTNCLYFKICDGASIELIRKKGFSILQQPE